MGNGGEKVGADGRIERGPFAPGADGLLGQVVAQGLGTHRNRHKIGHLFSSQASCIVGPVCPPSIRLLSQWSIFASPPILLPRP